MAKSILKKADNIADTVSDATKAARKAAGSAADAASTAARKADDAADLLAAAGRKSDDIADAAGSAARKTDDIADAAGSAAKRIDPKTAAKLAVTAAVLGTAIWLTADQANTNKKTRECAQVCAPLNWDDYEQAGKPSDMALDYNTLAKMNAKLTAAGKEEVDDEGLIFCKDPNRNCDDYCLSNCKDKYQSAAKRIGGAAGGAAGGAVGSAASEAAKGLADALGIPGDILKYILYGVVGLVVIFILLKFIPK